MSGDRVRVRYTKWGGVPHWELDTVRLGTDEWGTWLYQARGVPCTRPGLSVPAPVGCVWLVSEQLCCTPSFHATWEAPPEATRFSVYVDMSTPAIWEAPDTVTMLDLDLDVVRLKADDAVAVLDEDEFAEHRVRYGYPDELCDLARVSCDEVVAALEKQSEPYASVGWQWLDRVCPRSSDSAEP